MDDAALQPDDAREAFTDILDRMRLLGDDFTAHPDDLALIGALAADVAGKPGPAEDVLTEEYCVQLELPPGSTYRVAARRLADVLDPESSTNAG
ncbi:MAG TPA: hypothetical protein VF590_15000 [Isosphaeraceae bacterium]|jgi:hypothetical protein